MGRLQNNPSIGWVHPNSTHVRALASGNKKSVFFFHMIHGGYSSGIVGKIKKIWEYFKNRMFAKSQKQRKNYARNTISNKPSNYTPKNQSMSLHFMKWGLRHDHFFVLWKRLDSHRNMLSPVREHKPMLGGSHFFWEPLALVLRQAFKNQPHSWKTILDQVHGTHLNFQITFSKNSGFSHVNIVTRFQSNYWMTIFEPKITPNRGNFSSTIPQALTSKRIVKGFF
jgi:hypothetical protein